MTKGWTKRLTILVQPCLLLCSNSWAWQLTVELAYQDELGRPME